MRLQLRFQTDYEWHALRRVIERARGEPIPADTYRINMSRGIGDGVQRLTVEVTVKDTATGHSLVAREEKMNDDTDSRPGS
jgi:hypothetical protein